MSEAASLNNAPDLPKSVEFKPEPAAIADANASPESAIAPNPTDDWQTVDFPGALSVDAIPSREAAVGLPLNPGLEGLDAALISPVPLSEDLSEQVQQLHAQNAALRQQIARITTDLAQEQVELQLEAARNAYTDLPAAEADGRSELATAKDYISRLLQELELAHQTSHRQQILVETLTEQLTSSQERIAELERACALTQQRFNEQMQQRLQAESTCRDLRMRLHRQQQQTLQFKAALEKSLEMPTRQQESLLLGVSDEDSGTDRADSSQSLLVAPEVVLKNQPVQPWGVPQAETGTAATNADRWLANLSSDPPETESATVLFQLEHQEPEFPIGSEEAPTEAQSAEDASIAIVPEATPPLPDLHQLGELLNQMFPPQSDPVAAAVEAPATPSPVLISNCF